MNELGVCYATGWGVERDPAEAEAWFRRVVAPAIRTRAIAPATTSL